MSSSATAGHLSRTAQVNAFSKHPEAGMDISLLAAYPPFPASFDTAEKVAHAHEHRDAIARVTAFHTPSNPGCSSRVADWNGWCRMALNTATDAPTAPSHCPSFGIVVLNPRHAPE